MINGIYGQTVSSYLSLEERRIHTAVAATNIRYLFKFTNDMTKKVKYCYGKTMIVNDRYIRNDFLHNTTEDLMLSRINFKPYGFWRYEVYEVSWLDDEAELSVDTAPITETTVLDVSDHNGVVQGKVHEGKLYITETSGSEQVKYTHHTETTTNYLYTDY
tara:strand:- start:5800 stop:6279 length:480 start_codon:yes stop_codon:yes gene_type:complete